MEKEKLINVILENIDAKNRKIFVEKEKIKINKNDLKKYFKYFFKVIFKKSY